MDFNWKTWFINVWEDNRRLTNSISNALLEAGAADKVIVPGMRPFRELLLEIYGIEQWDVRGLAYDRWDFQALPETLQTGPIEDVIEFGRSVRDDTRRLWADIPDGEFTKMRPSPAPYVPEGTAIDWLTYALENEIHHRGQGYVYLRLLGHEPPAFYIRTE